MVDYKHLGGSTTKLSPGTGHLKKVVKSKGSLPKNGRNMQVKDFII